MMLQYLPRIWKKKGLPLHIVYHTTYSCNSKCKTCFLWKEIDTKDIERELGVDEIRKIHKNLKDILWLQIGGGEPFLREDLPEVCNVFGDVDTIAIPTNCVDPERIEQNVKKILENITSAFFLALSLDGLQDMHDEIRGVKGNFNRVAETYERLDKLRKRFPNFKIAVNTVIMKENEDEIIKVIDYVKHNFSVDMHSFEFLRGKSRSDSLSLPSISKLKELITIIKDCINFYGYGGTWRGEILKNIKLYEHDLVLKTLQNNKKVIPCFAGQLSAVINPYGDVYACELIDEKIGNLRNFGYDFRKLWLSKEAQRIREKNKNCFCTHTCFYLINSLFNPMVLATAFLSIKNSSSTIRRDKEKIHC